MIKENIFNFNREEEVLIPLTIEQNETRRYNKLSTLISNAELQMRKIAIDKPYIKGSNAVGAQERSYNEMFRNAQLGLYTKKLNADIIKANISARDLIAPAILILNNVRRTFEKMIENNDDKVDSLFDKFYSLKLMQNGVGLTDLTKENLKEVKDMFGE